MSLINVVKTQGYSLPQYQNLPCNVLMHLTLNRLSIVVLLLIFSYKSFVILL